MVTRRTNWKDKPEGYDSGPESEADGEDQVVRTRWRGEQSWLSRCERAWRRDGENRSGRKRRIVKIAKLVGGEVIP